MFCWLLLILGRWMQSIGSACLALSACWNSGLVSLSLTIKTENQPQPGQAAFLGRFSKRSKSSKPLNGLVENGTEGASMETSAFLLSILPWTKGIVALWPVVSVDFCVLQRMLKRRQFGWSAMKTTSALGSSSKMSCCSINSLWMQIVWWQTSNLVPLYHRRCRTAPWHLLTSWILVAAQA